MELTKKDRVLLINQYKILSVLYPSESDMYNEFIEILQHGYQLFYSEIDNWINDDMPEGEGQFVLEILQLYRIIDNFKRVNQVKEINDHYFSYFHGFDGNDESRYMSFARFLVNDQDRFTEQKQYFQKNDEMNSHAPTIDKYTNMLDKWRELGAKQTLNQEEILLIINA